MPLDIHLLSLLEAFIKSKGSEFIPYFGTKAIQNIAKNIPISGGVMGSMLGGTLAANRSIDYEIKNQLEIKDESFTQMLIRKIHEKNMTNTECYTKAHINRKLFSKIISNIHYKPQKKTVCAFIMGLELPLEEATEMLMKSGFAFSDSQRFDLIIKYFIRNQFYDISLINNYLFSYDQPLLGE